MMFRTSMPFQIIFSALLSAIETNNATLTSILSPRNAAIHDHRSHFMYDHNVFVCFPPLFESGLRSVAFRQKIPSFPLIEKRLCICLEKEEITEHILECKKVKEVLKGRDFRKEWIISEDTEKLMRMTEYIKGYVERRSMNILSLIKKLKKTENEMKMHGEKSLAHRRRCLLYKRQ